MAGKTTHIPVRTCVGCRAKKPKASMQRVVVENGALAIDSKQNKPSRGAYVCSEDCYNNTQGHLQRIIERKRR